MSGYSKLKLLKKAVFVGENDKLNCLSKAVAVGEYGKLERLGRWL